MESNTPQTKLLAAVSALLAVSVCVAVGVLASAQVATLLLAAVAFCGAALRLVLPAGVAFTVRRRAVDVTIMVTFGVALAFLGLTTPLG
ncbi:DUF3017 domain-containing protein [Demequina sediminicola]|uniref:DUF3017 domain-containing protein n=1 Tax=Demequina sediminicola TaxID=1095026 RepID=UPI00078282F8|nr:DUF3017 domain-containing protein [Demequina sediminicola]